MTTAVKEKPMMIKDIHINKAIDTNRRYDWLIALINEHVEEQVVFIGETFYDKDICIQAVTRFKDFVSRVEKKIFIQDVDSLSNEILDVSNESIYQLLESDKVQLFMRTSELDFIGENTETLTFSIPEKEEQVNPLTDEQVHSRYMNELEFHGDDLIGIYLSEILSSEEAPEKKQRLIEIGFDAMKRRD